MTAPRKRGKEEEIVVQDIKINLCASERSDLLEACRVAIRYNQQLLYSEKWTSNYSPYDEDDLNEDISRLQELQIKLMGAT